MIGGPRPAAPPRRPPADRGAARARAAAPATAAVRSCAMMIMDGGASRYRLDLYVQVFNLFNTTNLNGFVGNLLSPYFGTATSAAAARRIEIGASLSF